MSPAILVFPLIALCVASSASALESSLSWKQEDTRLTLQNHEHTVWQFVFDPAVSKPHFHPLATLDGDVLTGFEPPDHPWHRGLWWAWKYINGVNYWEENRETGLSNGLTRLVRADVTPADDFSATATLEIHYHPPGEKTLLTETRQLAISAPGDDGTYIIDWKSTFTTDIEPVSLDRTLPAHLGGPNYGGYAGLSLRLAKDLDEAFAFQTRDGGKTAAETHGKPATWIGITGPRGGIAIFDHPENPSRQAPWYVHSSPHMRFFAPAPLFNEPLALCAGQSITFNYRVIVHSKPMAHADIDVLWNTFTLTSVCAHANLLDPTSPDRYGTAEIIKAIKLAHFLGVKHVVTTEGDPKTDFGHNLSDDQRLFSIQEKLHEPIRWAEALGIEILLEPHGILTDTVANFITE